MSLIELEPGLLMRSVFSFTEIYSGSKVWRLTGLPSEDSIQHETPWFQRTLVEMKMVDGGFGGGWFISGDHSLGCCTDRALCTEPLPWEALLSFSQATDHTVGVQSIFLQPSGVCDMGRISAQSTGVFFSLTMCPNNVEAVILCVGKMISRSTRERNR